MNLQAPFTKLTEEGTQYLGFRVNNKGLVNNLSQKINTMCTTLHTAARINLSLFGKVNFIKAYALSKLWYLAAIHGLSEEE